MERHERVELRALIPADAGELLTLQRAAYATEAQLYNDLFLPARVQTHDELFNELADGDGLAAHIGPRLVAAVRTTSHQQCSHRRTGGRTVCQ